MLILKPGYNLVQTQSDLPNPGVLTNLYMDFETKNIFGIAKPEDSDRLYNFKKEHGGMYPFGGDRITGVAVTWDENSQGFYIPLRHMWGQNIDLDVVRRWMQDILNRCTNWINHNVGFDKSFAHFEGIQHHCNLIDTYALARIHDSERLKYGLKPLTNEWLGYSLESSDAVGQYLKAAKSKDWSIVPADILGEYAIDDVFRNRELYQFLLKNKESSLDKIWETEMNMTSVLSDMEIDGLEVDIPQCKKESMFSLRKMIDSGTSLTEFLGEEFCDSTQKVHQILVERLKLPVLMTIKEKLPGGKVRDTGRPSFDADALAMYAVHPNVVSSQEASDLVRHIQQYRTESQFFSLYSEGFITMADEHSRVHPNYNPIVRTGRMSCSRPNIQQQNERSKKLILPGQGRGFISKDYSQIEFRLIVHYINDIQAIEAYNRDPKTDFHQWLAEMIHCTRKAAKTLNFGMAYGAGKTTVTRNLISNPDIIEEIGKKVAEMNLTDAEASTKLFASMCLDRATEVYAQYHERLPGIKQTAYRASEVCKMRGFVFNAYGRRRHLPNIAAHKAFNSIIQGTAMDIMKEAMVRLSPRFNAKSREYDLKLCANVHDEILVSCPADRVNDPEIHKHIDDILENPSIQFRIPIRTTGGVSTENWAKAKAS